MENIKTEVPDILNIPKDMKNEIEILAPEKPNNVEIVDTSVDKDFETARENIKNIIDRGDKALDSILDIAKVSEHPRTYEVAGQLIKTLIDANKDLVSIHKQVKDIKSEENASDNPKNVTNAIFVGSTAELQKLIKEKKDV